MPVLSASTLTEFATGMLIAAGVPAETAAVVAGSLVAANLCGHDSHGVMRLATYIERVQSGRINPHARLTTVSEMASILVADGSWGFGQVVARDLVERLIQKASLTGLAAGTLRNTGHIGRLGEWAEIAAREGFASIIVANTHGSGQRVAPVGGIRARLGTNPLCIGVPGGEAGAFILDIGTSAAAEGKVRVKAIGNEPVPTGWLLDSNGSPTTDAKSLYADPPGSILPLGGDQAYKGFGLAFMIELLASGFSGAPTAHPNPPPPLGNAVMMLLLQPSAFGGSEHLLNEARQLEAYVRSTPRRPGVEQIMLPGDPERSVAIQRSRNGIFLDDGNWQSLVKVAESLQVAIPAVA